MTAIHVLLVSIALLCSASSVGNSWQDDFDALLKRDVAANGIRYAAWKANPADIAALDNMVANIGSANLSGLDRDAKLARYRFPLLLSRRPD